MQEQQQAPARQSTTLAQKADILAGLAMFPALTVMVFLRRKIGYRFLSPIKLFAMTAIIWILGGLTTIIPTGQQNATATYGGVTVTAPPASSPTGAVTPFIIFAFIMLAAGMIERYLRWRDIKSGVSWHTYSRGVSWFTFLPISDSKIKRFIDPLAVAIVGLIVMLIFKWLGYYIIFSAVCLFVFEAWDYEQNLNRMLDQLDNLVDSEVISDNVAYYSRDGQAQQRPLEETAGIPTGIAPDIEAQIQRRRARSQQPQPQEATVQAGRYDRTI